MEAKNTVPKKLAGGDCAVHSKVHKEEFLNCLLAYFCKYCNLKIAALITLLLLAEYTDFRHFSASWNRPKQRWMYLTSITYTFKQHQTTICF